jgi:hypothetical protein
VSAFPGAAGPIPPIMGQIISGAWLSAEGIQPSGSAARSSMAQIASTSGNGRSARFISEKRLRLDPK